MPQQTYTVKLSDGRELDVTTEGGPPSEKDILAHLSSQSSTPTEAPKRTYEYPTTAGFLKNAAKGAVRQVQGAADLAHTYQTQGLLGVAPKIVEGLKQLPARAGEWMNDPLQTIQDDPTAAALDVATVAGLAGAAPGILRGVRVPVGRGMGAIGRGMETAGSNLPPRYSIPGAAGALGAGSPELAATAAIAPPALKYGGKLMQVVGRKIQGPTAKPVTATPRPPPMNPNDLPLYKQMEGMAPEAPQIGRGFDSVNLPVLDPRIGGIMEGEVAPVGSRVTHPTPSVQPNMGRGATTPQVLPESWGKLTDAFTGTNAQLNAKLVKARILMKTQPELSLEQAMKIVAKQ